ncbi:MAG TPA: hypothetical protein ENH38_02250, partial [Nitrospirae bacterium]|nr:hypothetical protein [Nitrospirota bacterium]
MLPELCIIGYIFYTVAVFIIADLKIILVASALLFILMIILPYRKLKTGVVPIALFLSVTFLSNLLFNPGRILYKIGPLVITEEGMYMASVRALRVFLLIAGAKFLTIVTTLEDAINAMGRILSPLEKMGLPVKSFFDTMALSVKILPIISKKISEEYNVRIESSEKKGIRDKAAV